MKKLTLPAIAVLFAAAGLFALYGCGDSDAEDKKKDKEAIGPGDNDGPIPALANIAPSKGKPSDAKSKEIEALTGAFTRIVWAQQQNPAKTDAHANGTRFKLLGWDTRDGKGERVILDQVTNYARPLLTPDGKRIVFTNKGTRKDSKGRKSYRPRCFVVNWDGSGLKELGEGYADDVWADPDTGWLWVYVVSKFKKGSTSATEGEKLDRFLLDRPSKRETVFGKPTSPNNIMVSRDGSQIGGLFPWSYGGRLDVAKKDWVKTVKGCWTAISPDNSYVTWTFDGKHQNVWMTTPDGRQWEVPVNTRADLRSREVYHPRWTNHPQFFTISGPYPNGTRDVDGKKVQIYIGKFSTNLEKVEDWVMVTGNKLADVFPDVWISGGELSSLPAKLGPGAKGGPLVTGTGSSPVQPAEVVDPGSETPVNGAPGDQLVFLWKNNNERNKLGEGEDSIDCKLTVSGLARFDHYYHVLTGGGSAVIDPPSSAYADRFLGESPVTLAFMARPGLPSQAGKVVEFSGVTVGQEGNRWTVSIDGKTKSLGTAEAGAPAALILSIDDSSVTLTQGGTSATLKKSNLPRLAKAAQLRIGDAKWDGAIGQIHLYARLLDDGERKDLSNQVIAESRGEPEPARIKFRGKMVKAAAPRPLEAMEPYRRLLVPCVYEIEEVLSGEYAEDKIIVYHWAVLDLEPLPNVPPAVGQSVEVTAAPFESQPQLGNELTEEIADPSLVLIKKYYDISPPKP